MQDLYTISPRVQHMARLIVTHELAQQPEPASLGVALDTIYAKLRRRLVDLVGQAGFTALFRRALHLTRRAAPIVGGISIDAEAPMTLRGTHDDAVVDDETASAYALIVANFIWLLEIFLDVELSTRLIAEIWPQVAYAEVAHGGTDS